MTQISPTNQYRRRQWSPLTSPLRPTVSRRLMIYIGAPQPGEAGFVRCFLHVGDIAAGRKEAEQTAGDLQVWIWDVMSGERWTRAAGQGWREVGDG